MNTICWKYDASHIKKKQKTLSDSINYDTVPPTLITHSPFTAALQTSTLSHPRHETTQQQAFWKTEKESYCLLQVHRKRLLKGFFIRFSVSSVSKKLLHLSLGERVMKASGKEGTNTGKPRKVTVFIEKKPKSKPHSLHISIEKHFSKGEEGERKKEK